MLDSTFQNAGVWGQHRRRRGIVAPAMTVEPTRNVNLGNWWGRKGEWREGDPARLRRRVADFTGTVHSIK